MKKMTAKEILKAHHKSIGTHKTFNEYIYTIRKIGTKNTSTVVSAVDYLEILYSAIDNELIRGDVLYLLKD